MRKAIFLATVCLLAMLIFAPVALAQEETTPAGATPTDAGESDGNPPLWKDVTLAAIIALVLWAAAGLMLT